MLKGAGWAWNSETTSFLVFGKEGGMLLWLLILLVYGRLRANSHGIKGKKFKRMHQTKLLWQGLLLLIKGDILLN